MASSGTDLVNAFARAVLVWACGSPGIGSPGEVGVSAGLRRSEGAIDAALGYLGSLSESPLLRAELKMGVYLGKTK